MDFGEAVSSRMTFTKKESERTISQIPMITHFQGASLSILSARGLNAILALLEHLIKISRELLFVCLLPRSFTHIIHH